jgi:small-conductance mechanosensitive channel
VRGTEKFENLVSILCVCVCVCGLSYKTLVMFGGGRGVYLERNFEVKVRGGNKYTFSSCLTKNIVAINTLNVELNLICHLLIVLGDLTFMGTCIVSICQYIYNKMQSYTFYLYLKTALHVSDGTSTHHQERIQLYLQHLVFVTPLLLSAAIVEEL